MTRSAPQNIVLAGALALVLSACATGTGAPSPTPTDAPAWAGNMMAFPVAGSENRIYISGTVGSATGDMLLGAITPYGSADLTGTSGCIGGGTITMSSWAIEPHGSISLVLGSGYLSVSKASGLPEPGSEMPVTLRFSNAGTVMVSAAVQPVEREDTPFAEGTGCDG